jgi:hypothetical protein
MQTQIRPMTDAISENTNWNKEISAAKDFGVPITRRTLEALDLSLVSWVGQQVKGLDMRVVTVLADRIEGYRKAGAQWGSIARAMADARLFRTNGKRWEAAILQRYWSRVMARRSKALGAVGDPEGGREAAKSGVLAAVEPVAAGGPMTVLAVTMPLPVPVPVPVKAVVESCDRETRGGEVRGFAASEAAESQGFDVVAMPPIEDIPIEGEQPMIHGKASPRHSLWATQNDAGQWVRRWMTLDEISRDEKGNRAPPLATADEMRANAARMEAEDEMRRNKYKAILEGRGRGATASLGPPGDTKAVPVNEARIEKS